MSERRAYQMVSEDYQRHKDTILDRCVATICEKGIEAVDIMRNGYPSWRQVYHTRLLRGEYHYYDIKNALKLAQSCGVRVRVTAE